MKDQATNVPALHVSLSVPSKIGRPTGCLAEFQTVASSPKITAITSYTKEAISKKRAMQPSAAWSTFVNSPANGGPILYATTQSGIAPAPTSSTHAPWFGASTVATTASRARISSRATIRTFMKASLDQSRPVESSSQLHSSLKSPALEAAPASRKSWVISFCCCVVVMVRASVVRTVQRTLGNLTVFFGVCQWEEMRECWCVET